MIKQLSTIAASLMLATAAYGQTTTPTTPPAAKTAPGAVDQNGASMTSPPATVTPRATTASPVHLTDEQAKVWIVSVSRTFQLPTIPAVISAPSSMSVKRDRPRHITTLPGGGSLARAR